MQPGDNPGHTPEQKFRNPMRRLCIFHYHCPMCGQNHDFHIYVTREVTDLDEFHAGVQLLAASSDFQTSTLNRAAVRLHSERGDLEKQARRFARRGPRRTQPPRVELTNEQHYTCDQCSRTFDTMRSLRSHMETCR